MHSYILAVSIRAGKISARRKRPKKESTLIHVENVFPLEHGKLSLQISDKRF